MSYLNLDLDYFQHPKVRRLVGLLGRDTEVYPLRLWCYCGKYHPGDGKLSGYSVQEIESILEWHGDVGRLADALIKTGIIHKNNSGFIVHDWDEHNGHLKAFKERSKKANKARWDKYKNNATSSVDGFSLKESLNQNKESSKESPLPTIPTKPNLTKEKNQASPAPVYSQELVDKARKADAIGFNVFQQVNLYNKGKLNKMPESVMIEILDEFFKYKDSIKGDVFPYMKRVVIEKSRRYWSEKNVNEHQEIKKGPVAAADVLRQLANSINQEGGK